MTPPTTDDLEKYEEMKRRQEDAEYDYNNRFLVFFLVICACIGFTGLVTLVIIIMVR